MLVSFKVFTAIARFPLIMSSYIKFTHLSIKIISISTVISSQATGWLHVFATKELHQYTNAS